MSSNQFTLALHFYKARSRENHFDLFLDRDGESELETYRCLFREKPLAAGMWRFTRINPHRRSYLTYSGPVSKGRGRVRILRRGKFVDLRKNYPDRLRVSL